MKQFIYLSTCDTCKKIMSELDLSQFEVREIKSNPLKEEEINQLKELAGSYEDLFSKRAQLYKKLGLKDQNLTEEDFKKYLLEHYTFLKRPVVVNGDEIYIGSSPKTKALLKEKWGK
ncbi:MAG: arsenate reductase family protein [Weeksellaceae bacterium]